MRKQFLLVCILVSILTVGTAEPEKVSVIVGFKDKPDIALIKQHGGDIKHEYTIITAVACSLPEKACDALKKHPKVEYVEPDIEMHTLQQVLPWGVERIGANLVHPYNNGSFVKIAILDTGIDYTHPDLAANYRGGVDYVEDDLDPLDDNGHGTHVAGIIAAVDNDVGVVGVAPEAELYAVKVLDRQGRGGLSDVIAGIDWAVRNNMDVISMSLGTSTYSASLETACSNAYNAGVVLVAAAGNSGDGDPTTDEYSYPAAYESVIAVGATDDTDTAPYWSNSGPYLELAAPGVSIYSTMPTYRVTLTPFYGLDYGTMSGTSMACPHVTGTVALVLNSPIGDYDLDGDGAWDPVEVRLRLNSTATDLGTAGWDTVYGYGLVNASKAAPQSLVDTTPPTISSLTPDDGSYINNQTPRISAIVSDASGINASSIVMKLDGTVVLHQYNSTTGFVYYDVTSPLVEGIHTVLLNVSDNVGNLASVVWSFTVDITPPLISNVSISGVTSTSATITWTTNELADSVVNYNTSLPLIYTASDPTLVINHSITLTGLNPDTTYYFEVQSTDTAGNTAVDNNSGLYYNFTTLAGNLMRVSSIDMSLVERGPWTYAIATVTVVDADGSPVEGATVYGHWSGLTTDSDSGVTDASGQVSLSSDRVRDAEGLFTFTVDDVVLSGYIYDEENSVTSASIEV